MSLRDEVKVALRVTSEMTDSEVDMWIEAAKADMERIGVRRYMIQDGTMDPYVRAAIVLFCKAHYGFDNSEASRFLSSYRQIVKDILNSPTRYAEYTTRGCGDALERDGGSPGQP